MKEEKRYVSHILFEIKLLKSSGQDFQNLFVQIMQYADSGFKPVKPYGNLGDKKNDGFNFNKGIYYQVYAPEDIEKTSTVANACKKLNDDFIGLYNYWNNKCTINEYCFVINDKAKGLPPQLYDALLALKKEYPNVSFDFLLAKDLSKIVGGLGEEALDEILGFIPSLEVSDVYPSDMLEAVNYLLNAEVDLSTIDKLIVPDYYQKIAFNGLGADVLRILDEGSMDEGLLQEFFNENPTLNLKLQLRMKNLYQKVVEEIPYDEEDCGNKRFFSLIKKCSNGDKVKQSVLSCFYSIIAFYFSSCDIFEEPIVIAGQEEKI